MVIWCSSVLYACVAHDPVVVPYTQALGTKVIRHIRAQPTTMTHVLVANCWNDCGKASMITSQIIDLNTRNKCLQLCIGISGMRSNNVYATPANSAGLFLTGIVRLALFANPSLPHLLHLQRFVIDPRPLTLSLSHHLKAHNLGHRLRLRLRLNWTYHF